MEVEEVRKIICKFGLGGCVCFGSSSKEFLLGCGYKVDFRRI